MVEKYNYSEMTIVHQIMDCKYHACIEEWERGMSWYFADGGFRYEYIDSEYELEKNL